MTHRLDDVRRIWRRYRREMRCYRRETSSAVGFIRLMQVRLSLSKIGWLACPRRKTISVDMASFGGPVCLRSHSTDISVLKELVLGDSYAAASGHASDPVRTIVDLGANTGLAARWLVERHRSASVVCVEPEPDNASVLRRNLEPLGHRATAVEACIGARERTVSLATRTGAWGYSMTDAEDPAAEGSASVRTLEFVLAEAGFDEIDLLKCDIEGAEVELFAACEDWIERVRVAVVECHDEIDAPGLVGLIEAAGGQFRIVEREPNPVRGYETVTLVNVGRD